LLISSTFTEISFILPSIATMSPCIFFYSSASLLLLSRSVLACSSAVLADFYSNFTIFKFISALFCAIACYNEAFV
jgi:hypothetical protein